MNVPRNKTSGYSLLETIVAVLVLAIGILGLASLQSVGLRSQHTSTLSVQATQLAYDMAEKMRANKNRVDAGDYHSQTAPTTPPSGCLGSTGCAPTTMAQMDLYQWQQSLSQHLPGGSGSVCRDNPATTGTACDGGSVDPFRILVAWNERAELGSSSAAPIQRSIVIYFLP
jgi:type IV pilus assembly protein PilV